MRADKPTSATSPPAPLLPEQPSDAAGSHVSAPASGPNTAVASAAAPVPAASAGAHISPGNETGHITNNSAPAPAPQAASGNATVASATQLALLGSSSTKRHGPVMMLCKPVPAAGDRLEKAFVICITVIPGSIILICCCARVAHLRKRRRQVQG